MIVIALMLVMTVVGFKLESILEAFPDGVFVYNENFDTTNTSKSLLKALRFSSSGPVLWMNGDVVFDPEVLRRLESSILRGDNVICVNTSAVGDEEVKYTVDDHGLQRRVGDLLRVVAHRAHEERLAAREEDGELVPIRRHGAAGGVPIARRLVDGKAEVANLDV